MLRVSYESKSFNGTKAKASRASEAGRQDSCLMHLIHIKDKRLLSCKPQNNPTVIKPKSFTHQHLRHGRQIHPCAADPATSHVSSGISPKPLSLETHFTGVLGQGWLLTWDVHRTHCERGKKTTSNWSTHRIRWSKYLGADFRVSATRRSNINIVNLQKTGMERMKLQRDLGIL